MVVNGILFGVMTPYYDPNNTASFTGPDKLCGGYTCDTQHALWRMEYNYGLLLGQSLSILVSLAGDFLVQTLRCESHSLAFPVSHFILKYKGLRWDLSLSLSLSLSLCLEGVLVASTVGGLGTSRTVVKLMCY